MRSEVIFAPEAVEDLRRLKANIRAAVLASIQAHLKHEPRKQSRSRIKKLKGIRRPEYRLRVDEARVYYDVKEPNVEILAIVVKSEAREWLAQFGEPE